MHLNDDLPTLAELALAASTFLIDRAQTVAVAESAAGGLVSAALLAVPGASRYFLGGTVIYTRRAARGLLGLTAPEVAGLRGETEPYVQLLARTVRDRLGATWGLAESGAAGPKGSPYGDPPGRACLAVIGPATRIRTIETAASVRTENMDLFARHLMKEFVGLLSGTRRVQGTERRRPACATAIRSASTSTRPMPASTRPRHGKNFPLRTTQ